MLLGFDCRQHLSGENDPSEYLSYLFERIFRYPDTFLYNTADNAGFLLPQDSQNVMVSSNGTVFWPLPLAQLRTRCRMTIKHFPFGNRLEISVVEFIEHFLPDRKELRSR